MATIQFRSDPDLDEKLDILVERAQRSGESASRSTVARAVLRQALGGSKLDIVYQEAIKQTHAIIQRVVNRALSEVLENLDDLIEGEIE